MVIVKNVPSSLINEGIIVTVIAVLLVFSDWSGYKTTFSNFGYKSVTCSARRSGTVGIHLMTEADFGLRTLTSGMVTVGSCTCHRLCNVKSFAVIATSDGPTATKILHLLMCTAQ